MPSARRRTTTAVLAAAAILAALPACDTAPGAPAILPQPPALEGFTVTPDSFLLPGAAPIATIPITLAGSVTSADGGPITVHYLVRRQGDDTLAVTGSIDVAAPGPFLGADELTVPRGASGLYLVEVVAVGRDGRAGARASDLVRFEIEPLGPPSIAAVVLDPPVVSVPASGATSLRVVATVSDPDGLANLGYVSLQPVGGGLQFPLSDSGPIGQSGDASPGDGRYTVTLEIAAGTQPGQVAFEVVARDREGLEAVPFPVTIIIQ